MAPRVFVEAVKYCAEELAAVIGARISGKSRFLANSKTLLQATVDECGKEGLIGKGEGAKISKYMGVDYSAAAQVTGFRPARKKRWRVAKAKVGRASRLRRAGADVGGVWAAGPGASISYGAEVYGVNGGVLEAYRRATGAAVLGGAAGRSLTAGFLLAGKGGQDPMHTVGIAPIYAWAMEAWRRRNSLSVMRVAWRGVSEKIREAKKMWAVVRGPAAATWASLQRLGWKFTTPFSVKSDIGIDYDILKISPKRFKRRLHEGVDRWGWRKVLEQTGVAGEEVGEMAARVRTEWAREVLHKHGGSTAQEKGALRSVMDGSVWTEEKCWEEGYLDFPLCKRCLAGIGTTQHRAYGCGELAVGEEGGLKEEWREEGCCAEKKDPYWTRPIPVGPDRAPWTGGRGGGAGMVRGRGDHHGRGFRGRVS